MDSLVQAIRVFSKDIRKEFVIEKCTVLVIEKLCVRKIVKSVSIELPDGKGFKSLQEGEIISILEF